MLKRFFVVCIIGFYTLISTLCASSITAQSVFFQNIQVGENPSGLAVDGVRNRIYVANIGENTVSVVDGATKKVIKTISGFDQPYTITVAPGNFFAYVTNSAFGGANTVSIIDLYALEIIATISGFNAPSGMAIASSSPIGYVNNYGDPHGVAGNTLSVVNLMSNTITDTVVVGDYPSAVGLTPNQDYLYVLNYTTGNEGEGTVSVISLSGSPTVIKTISGFWGPYQIAMNPQGTRAYVTNYGNNFNNQFGQTVSVIDIDASSSTFNTIIATIIVGSQPSGIVVDSAGKYAYVTLYNNGSIGSFKKIDLSTNTVVSSAMRLGAGPAQIALSSNDGLGYVVNYGSNTLEIISFPLFTILLQGCLFQNRFLTQVDLINRLSWTITGDVSPVRYALYRNFSLTEQVVSTTYKNYLDHNRIPGRVYTYYLVCFNNAGLASTPVALSVKECC